MVIHQLYKISVFGDFSDIQPTTDNMLFLLNAYKDFEMVPSMYQELNFPINSVMLQIGPVPQQSAPLLQRIALMTSNTQERFILGSNRIDYEISIIDENVNNIEHFAVYNKKIYEAFNRLFEHYKKSSSRFALNTNSWIIDLSANELREFFSRYTNPISIYQDVIMDEWSTRLMTKQKKTIDEMDEVLNIITGITKGLYYKTDDVSHGMPPVDGFVIDIDINTIAENTANRFSSANLSTFLSEALYVWNEVWGEIQ